MRNNPGIDEVDYYGLHNTNNQKLRLLFGLNTTQIDKFKKSALLETILSEGCDSFVSFVECLGLARDPDMVVLSSEHHYYYDAEEMKNVHTVINLKELNRMKNIKSFIQTIYSCLPSGSNLVGCFVDNTKFNGFALKRSPSNYYQKKKLNSIENGIVSEVSFLNMIYSIMDSRTYNYLSTQTVTALMESIGFKILHIVELNGITYFHSHKSGIGGN